MKHLPAIAVWLLLAALPATAQTFDVVLGGKTLGQMTYSETAGTASLTTTLNSTPMGVFNGSFRGVSADAGASTVFKGESQSSRKSRIVIVQINDGQAIATDITPDDERTALSEISGVPGGVQDPVRVMAAMINAQGCPAALRMYDGRRVASLTPAVKTLDGTNLSCRLDYRVIAGPGHLSPLGISSAALTLLYHTSDGAQRLQKISLSSGVFRLKLDRVD